MSGEFSAGIDVSGAASALASFGGNPSTITNAVMVAHDAWTAANATMDDDKRSNNPNRIAFDQQAVDKAVADLAEAKGTALAAGLLDVTA
jgi:hypothetical protein